MAQRVTVQMIETLVRRANEGIAKDGPPFMIDSGYGDWGVMRDGKRIAGLSSTTSCYYEFRAYINGYADGAKSADKGDQS